MGKADTTKLEHITAAVIASEEGDTKRFDAQLRAILAAYHIQAAAALARQAKRIESENAERAFNRAFNPIFWSASASVLLAWAALEANINQLIKTFEDENAGNTGRVERCSFLYGEPVVTKYKGLARLKESELLESDEIFKNFETLGDFRNTLVDFQPEWHDEEEKHAKLCKKMREILKPPSGMPSDAVFPFCHLGYECAKWAVVTASGVSAHYATLIGVEDHLAASWLDLELP
jgi:hypothetical protein